MCYTWPSSLAFAVVGWLTTAGLLARGRSVAYVLLPAFFAAMETMQLLSYGLADRCSSRANQALTLAAFAHMALQPLVFNEWVFGQAAAAFRRTITGSGEGDRTLQRAVRRLCLAAAALMLLKATPGALVLLGVGEPQLTPLIGLDAARALTGPSTWCRDAPEMLCGRRLCSFNGRLHLAWSVPQLPQSYYLPSTAFLHFFMLFVPALLLGGAPQRLLSLTALVAGPLATDRLVVGDERARQYEWASMWCLFSMAQVLALVFIEAMRGRWSRQALGAQGLKAPGYTRYSPQAHQQQALERGEAIAVIHMAQQFPGYRQRSGFMHRDQQEQQYGALKHV